MFSCPSCLYQCRTALLGVRDCFLTYKCPYCNKYVKISPGLLVKNTCYFTLIMSFFWMLYLPIIVSFSSISIKHYLFVIPIVFVGLSRIFISKSNPPLVDTGAIPTNVSPVRAGLAYGADAYVFVESALGPLLFTYCLSRSLYLCATYTIVVPLALVPASLIIFSLYKLVLWNLQIKLSKTAHSGPE